MGGYCRDRQVEGGNRTGAGRENAPSFVIGKGSWGPFRLLGRGGASKVAKPEGGREERQAEKRGKDQAYKRKSSSKEKKGEKPRTVPWTTLSTGLWAR